MSHSVMIRKFRKTCSSYTCLKDVGMADVKTQLLEILMDYHNIIMMYSKIAALKLITVHRGNSNLNRKICKQVKGHLN